MQWNIKRLLTAAGWAMTEVEDQEHWDQKALFALKTTTINTSVLLKPTGPPTRTLSAGPLQRAHLVCLCYLAFVINFAPKKLPVQLSIICSWANPLTRHRPHTRLPGWQLGRPSSEPMWSVASESPCSQRNNSYLQITSSKWVHSDLKQVPHASNDNYFLVHLATSQSLWAQ